MNPFVRRLVGAALALGLSTLPASAVPLSGSTWWNDLLISLSSWQPVRTMLGWAGESEGVRQLHQAASRDENSRLRQPRASKGGWEFDPNGKPIAPGSGGG